MSRIRPTTVIPSAVIELARKAEEINVRQVTRKLIFNTAVIVGALLIVAVDILAISQGVVTTDPGKKLAAFVALGAGALLLVGLMSFLALLTSALSYQRLNLLVERAEREEVAEEEEVLLKAVAYALREVPEPSRKAFVNALKRAEPLEEHPALAELVVRRFAAE